MAQLSADSRDGYDSGLGGYTGIAIILDLYTHGVDQLHGITEAVAVMDRS